MNKYYQTVYTITVLTEQPLGDVDLERLNYETMEGHAVMKSFRLKEKEITAKQAVRALYAAGSEPAFFQLDDNGNEIDC